jgi:hypothetical protein
MANVIIRFSIYSKVETTTRLLEKLLPNPDEITTLGNSIILTDGKDSGKKYQETAYTYNYELKDISDIEECSAKWLSEWENETDLLCKLSDEFGFSLDLNYEVTTFNNKFPYISFQPKFSSILGKTGIQFSLYFYTD